MWLRTTPFRVGLHSPLHPDLFIPIKMRACTCAYDKYIMFTYVYIYIYIFFFESSVPESEKKREGEGKKGKKNGKMGDQRFSERFFTWSVPF